MADAIQPVRNIGLAATGMVGLEVARFMAESGVRPAFIAYDPQADPALNRRMIDACGLDSSLVFPAGQLKNPSVLERLQGLGLDLVVLAWWPHIIKQPLISLPRLGCLNFHPSLLPRNRGKHYNFWSLVEESPFGVTLHFVTEGVDDGDIAFQAAIATTWEDTGKTLYLKAQEEIVALFKRSFPQILTGDIPRVEQQLWQGSFHKAAELEAASQIDLDRKYTARELLNLLRARTFLPHPAAWFVEGGQKYEVRVQINRLDAKG